MDILKLWAIDAEKLRQEVFASDRWGAFDDLPARIRDGIDYFTLGLPPVAKSANFEFYRKGVTVKYGVESFPFKDRLEWKQGEACEGVELRIKCKSL